MGGGLLGRFTAVSLTPAAPYSIDSNRTLVVKQIALAAPLKPDTVAVVSVQTSSGVRVLCSLSAARPQVKCDVVLKPNADRMVVTGAAVDVCGIVVMEHRVAADESADESAEEHAVKKVDGGRQTVTMPVDQGEDEEEFSDDDEGDDDSDEAEVSDDDEEDSDDDEEGGDDDDDEEKEEEARIENASEAVQSTSSQSAPEPSSAPRLDKHAQALERAAVRARIAAGTHKAQDGSGMSTVSSEGVSVFVRGLPFDTTDQGLEDLFSEIGPVRGAFIVTDKVTKASRGFGFVEFALVADAHRAVEMMHGSEMGGRKLTVDLATKGEHASAAPPRGASTAEAEMCFNCGAAGHLVKDCPYPKKVESADDGESGLEDMEVVCKDCHETFIFTVREQKFFLENGYNIPRIRCKGCSDAKKQGGYDKSGMGAVPNPMKNASGGKGGYDAGKGGGKGGGKGWGKGDGGKGWGKGDGGKGKGGGGKGKGEGRRVPTATYTCNLCGLPGHFIEDCSLASGAKGGGKGGGGGGKGGGKGAQGKGAGPREGESRVCYAFQQGECNRGASCAFLHS